MSLLTGVPFHPTLNQRLVKFRLMEGLDDCSGEYSIGLCNVYMAIHDVITYLKCFPRLFCLDLLSSFYYSYSCVRAVLVILFCTSLRNSILSYIYLAFYKGHHRLHIQCPYTYDHGHVCNTLHGNHCIAHNLSTPVQCGAFKKNACI